MIGPPNCASGGTPAARGRGGASHSQASDTGSKRKRGIFQKELQHMMYGFGDDANPLPETVALVEDIVVEYVTDFAHKTQDIGSRMGKLSVEDFLYLDAPKLNRCKELLSMQEELRQARKAFDVDEVSSVSGLTPSEESLPIFQLFIDESPCLVIKIEGRDFYWTYQAAYVAEDHKLTILN